MTEALTVGEAVLNDEPAAFLYAPPSVPDGPVRHMIVPALADAGHLAAMAQYLTFGPDAIVYVHESAQALLGCEVEITGFAQKAVRRGVDCEVIEDGQALVLTSGDGTARVRVCFARWHPDMAGCSDALQLLDMASALHDATGVSIEA